MPSMPLAVAKSMPEKRHNMRCELKRSQGVYKAKSRRIQPPFPYDVSTPACTIPNSMEAVRTMTATSHNDRGVRIKPTMALLNWPTLDIIRVPNPIELNDRTFSGGMARNLPTPHLG